MRPRWPLLLAVALTLTACGGHHTPPRSAPTTSAPVSPSQAPTAGASEVVNHRPPSTYLPGPGHDVEHSTSGSPGVPWLWDGHLNLPDGHVVTPWRSAGELKDADILTFAEAPAEPGRFYALVDLGHGPEVTMFGQRGTAEPMPSTADGLVATPDGSLVAVLMHETQPPDGSHPWTLGLHSSSDTQTWTIPRGMTPHLVGVGASGAVVMNVSGPFAQSARPIYVARPGGAVEPLPVPNDPAGSDTYRAASVSPTGTELTVTFHQGERSCWGVAAIEDGTMRAYTCDGSVDPTFSPDGREIVALGNIDQPAVPGHPSYDLATIYDAETLAAIRVYTTTLAAAHGGNLELFAPTLVWDGDQVLVPVYDSGNDGPGGWTLAWLDPSGKPRYQYARGLLVPERMTSPSPFTFAANSPRE